MPMTWTYLMTLPPIGAEHWLDIGGPSPRCEKPSRATPALRNRMEPMRMSTFRNF